MSVQTIYSPSAARQNFFSILKQVNSEHEPVVINSSNAPEKEAVVMSKSDYDAMQETMALWQNGQLQDVLEREDEQTVVLPETSEGGIDWSKI
jgi:prevent-host-death family protein